MNGAETRAALKQIAETKSMEFESQLLHLEKTSKTERKALSMSRQIALALANITNVDFKERGYEIKQQRVFGMDFHDFDPLRSVFEKLTGEQRESFLEFSFAVIMAKHAFYEKRKEELKKAEQSSNVEKAFECRISIGVVEDILRAWQEWWDRNGCVACKIISQPVPVPAKNPIKESLCTQGTVKNDGNDI